MKNDPPAHMEIRIFVDEKQVIKFAWPTAGADPEFGKRGGTFLKNS